MRASLAGSCALACALVVTAVPEPSTTKFTVNVDMESAAAQAAIGQRFTLGDSEHSYAATLAGVEVAAGDAHRQLQVTASQVSITYVVTCGHTATTLGLSNSAAVAQDCGTVRSSLGAMYQTETAAAAIIDAITASARARNFAAAAVLSSPAEVAAGGTALLPPIVDIRIPTGSINALPQQAFPDSFLASVGGAPAARGFCFGTASSATIMDDFESGTDGWTKINEISVYAGSSANAADPGNWITSLPADYEAGGFNAGNMAEQAFATGWALYETDNTWGNQGFLDQTVYDDAAHVAAWADMRAQPTACAAPPCTDGPSTYREDNVNIGTFLVLDGVFDEFIMEVDVDTHDNDGTGFVFGFQSVDDHFTAHEINDVWPDCSWGCPADGYSGPFQKISRRSGAVPDPLTPANTPVSLLASADGDDGLSVNRASYTPFPDGPWFKQGLKVSRTLSGYLVEFQSTRTTGDVTTSIESVSAYTTDYVPGQVGFYNYANNGVARDNFRITPIDGSAISACNGRGVCGWTNMCTCTIPGADLFFADCSRGGSLDNSGAATPFVESPLHPTLGTSMYGR